jgi:photosystem II stability/assembly factor-like uncharacterized protein
LPAALGGPAGHAAALADDPLSRTTHGVLLGIARAGDRLVAVGDRGHVLLSDDDGKTWRAGKSGTDSLLTAVTFSSKAEGWAVGQDETVLHSDDGGLNWSTQHFTPNADQNLFSVAVLGPAHVLASGAYNLILETADGKDWKDGKLPDVDDDYHLNCAIGRGDDVLLTGESGHAFLRHAGAWAKMPVPYEGSQFGCLVGADGSFYSFGLRGSLFKAPPGATAWSRINTGGAESLFGGMMLPDGAVALVGGNGVFIVVDPATSKVTHMRSGTTAALSAVIQAKDGTFVIVGDDGVHVVDRSAVSGQEPAP